LTRDEVQEATAEAVRAAEALSAHLDRLSDRMRARFPIEPDQLALWEDQPCEQLHALLRMFEQLFDLTSRKLFRGLLSLSGESFAGFSAQNQFRRIEALGAIDNAERWIELAATRNILVHDYPVNPIAQAARANRAWQDLPALVSATRQTIQYLRRENLLS
jgi:hypothetical protein